MITCKKCGHHNPDGASFCANPDCRAFLEWTGEHEETGTIQKIEAEAAASAAGAVASLSQTELSVEPGAETTCGLTVRNRGAVVDQFTLGVLGDVDGWASVEPPELNLFPDSEGVATITFRPPRSSDVPAGVKSFKVRVASTEDQTFAATAEGTVEVGRFDELSAKLVPTTSEGHSQATHEFLLENRGNAVVSATVSAEDSENALTFTVSPRTLSVPPGRRARARVVVRPRESRSVGEPRPHPFEVLAEPDTGDTLRVGGKMIEAALIRRVTRGHLLALRILLTLIGAAILLQGASMEWLPGVTGVDLTYDQYADTVFGVSAPAPPEGVPTTLVALGLVAILLAALATLGILTRTGKPTRAAGWLGIVLFVAFLVTLLLAGQSTGVGVIVVLVGSVVVLIAGLIGTVSLS